MDIYSFYEMFYIFLFWSVIGWMIEVVDMRIEAGELQNRGFLHMPICPLYGLGMLFLNILLCNQNKSYGVLFLCGIFVGTFFEYMTGWILEKTFHTKWWDYSHMRFQYKGRICLRNTILFGFGAILTVGYIQPVLERAIHRMPTWIGFRILVFVGAILMFDLLISTVRASRYRNQYSDEGIYVIFKSHR